MKKKLYKLLPGFIKNKIRQLYYFKKFSAVTWNDEKDLEVIRLLVKPGDTVLDIGTNFGLYTKFLSLQVGNNGKVYAFEPVPDTFDTLENNVNKSGLINVTCIKKAVSNAAGEAYISIPTYEDGSENYYEASLQQANSKNGIRIETIALDEWYKNKIQQLSFIKLDVEGHEPEALQGMTKMIEEFHPKMMIEINDGFENGSIGQKVKTYMQEKGYTMKYFDGQIIRDTDGKEEGVNYIFIHQSSSDIK